MNSVSGLPFSNRVRLSKYCFPRSSSECTKSANIDCIGREQCNPDYIVDRADFGAYGIEFVASGIGEIVLNKKKYPLRAGTLFCYGPSTPHRITTDPEKPMTKYFVDVSGKGVCSLLKGTKLEPGCVFYTPEPEQFQTIFESLLSEGSKGLPRTHEICLGYFRILILKTDGIASTTSASLNQMSLNFQACKKAIDANFASMGNLEDIARSVHLSPAYICRLFRKFGHQSPFQYLIRKKLNYAAGLLFAGACSVKGVAYEVGYRDPYHFSRSFRRFFGTPPKDFAESHRRC